MKIYDLYGSKVGSVEDLCGAVSDAIGSQFQRHESGYLGGEYFLYGDLDGEHFIVQRNRYRNDEGEEEIAEAEFADYPVLLQVNASTRGDELREWLAGIVSLDFLRRSVP